MGEEVAGRGLVDDPDIEAVARVGADITIADEEPRGLVEPCGNGAKDAMKMSWVDGLVKVIPMDGGGSDLVFNDVPVLGRTAREGACPDHERTGIARHSFLSPKTVQYEVFRWQLVVDGIGDTQTETGEAVRRESNDRRWHRQSFVSTKLKLFFSLARQ